MAGLQIPEDGQLLRPVLERISAISFDDNLQSMFKVHEWIPRELYSVVALAQHHGFPTRFLDWTYTPKIATYFATEEAARRRALFGEETIAGSDRIAVWSFCVTELESRSDAGSRVWGGRYNNVFFVTAPRAANPLMHAQNGVFTYHKITRFAPDAAIDRRPLNEMLSVGCPILPEPLFKKITMPISQSGKLLFQLALDGIMAHTVFPDCRGAIRAVAEERYCDRRP